MLHRIEISTAATGHGTTIKLDGHDVAGGVRRFTLDQEAGKPSSLELEVMAIETARVQAEDCHVYLHEASRDLMERLGWTPPAEDPKGVVVHAFGKVAPHPDDALFPQATAPGHNQ